MENLFEKGCLVQLSTSVWGATRKINPSHLNGTAASANWLSASKKLIAPEALKPITKVVNKSRSYLTGISLPFPIHGMVFVPKEMISRVDDKLIEFKHKFEDQIQIFMEKYEPLRTTAMTHLGDLFNELDYPADLGSKFSFVWRFIILDVPNGNTSILAPEVYAREKDKFVQTMAEARELAIESLRTEFAGLIQRITDRFATGPDGKPKVFKNATVHNFYEFFETFKERNIFKDHELETLVENAKAVLNGRSADAIRSDEQLKDHIRSKIGDVESAMADIFDRPRRKIVLN